MLVDIFALLTSAFLLFTNKGSWMRPKFCCHSLMVHLHSCYFVFCLCVNHWNYEKSNSLCVFTLETKNITKWINVFILSVYTWRTFGWTLFIVRDIWLLSSRFFSYVRQNHDNIHRVFILLSIYSLLKKHSTLSRYWFVFKNIHMHSKFNHSFECRSRKSDLNYNITRKAS